MSNTTQQLNELSHEQASELDAHVRKVAHHLIDLKWTIEKAWAQETYTTSSMLEQLFATRTIINQACKAFELSGLHAADQ